MKRIRIELTGCLQGVGFRPAVYRIAQQKQLSGYVKNTAEGVTIEIQGKQADHFLKELQQQLPPLAVINDYVIRKINLQDEKEFIIQSSDAGDATTIINPDSCICFDCLNELFDKSSRFYCYPFLNCSHCGPRYSIAKHLPYDRQQTAMAKFTMCAQCHAEYHNPENRRYHAQATACNQCGPQLSQSLKEISEYIQQGKIVALKGLGGYQLICDATNLPAIKLLRERKQRAAKPFALMCLNIASAQQHLQLNNKECELLENWQRPIVLVMKKQNCLPEIIAPGLNQLGVMLAYTPLHYLLFHYLLAQPETTDWLTAANSCVLVVTSANISGEPLLIDDQQAQQKLANIADLIVSYDRDIVTRVDDSVIKMIGEKPVIIRRARGYTPQAIKLAHAIPTTLALGGHLKNTVCITRGDEAFLSQHIGDLDNRETINFYHETINHLLDFLAVQPERIACDQHPDFYSSHYAEDFNLPIYRVQHHHAHLAATIAEYHLQQAVLGLALDGYGYGADGNAWGGELMLLDNYQYQHLGQLQNLFLPGGDRAAVETWRMGLSVLAELGDPEKLMTRFSGITSVDVVAQQIKGKNIYQRTSSCGRLFDAVSALLGVCVVNDYEGQAAMWLESLVSDIKILENSWTIDQYGLNLLPLLEKLLYCDAKSGAELFHGTLAMALTDWLYYWSQQLGVTVCVLSGGCFANKILCEELLKQARQRNLQLYLAQQAPVNDAGIALGQAWISANL